MDEKNDKTRAPKHKDEDEIEELRKEVMRRLKELPEITIEVV
jgi:hypothetical protein